MFDLFANLLSTIASFLFPLYASYKALKTSDPASLTPWLMYWVVFGCMMLVESWTYWFFSWVPFYGYFRLGFILYLMLPQTQGARYMYETYLAPYLQENESSIEEFIVNAHEAARTIGLEYIQKAIEYARVQFLGMPPNEPEAPPPPPARSSAQSYTHMLLSRFTIPSARPTSSGSSGLTGGTGTSAGDFYNLLASAVSAVSGATAGPSSSTQYSNNPVLSMTSSGTLIPPNLRDAHEKMSFITAQRERLNIVLVALEKEAAQLQRQAARDGTRTPGSDFNDDSDRSALSKSRSETDFVKIDAESGDESGVRKRGNTGGWVPWGWNSGEDDGAKSSGADR